MAKYPQEVRHCNGGQVQFGLTGQSISVYLTKHKMCISDFQDARYGPQMRLHNACVKDGKVHYRCTVCGSGHGICRL